MKSNFLIFIGFIFFVNISHAQSSLVRHVNLSEGYLYGLTKQEDMFWNIVPRLHFDQSITRSLRLPPTQKIEWPPVQTPVAHQGVENFLLSSAPIKTELLDWTLTNSTNVYRLSVPKVTKAQLLTVENKDSSVPKTTEVQETLTEDVLTALLGPSSSPEMSIELSQTHELSQAKMSVTHQGSEDMILDSPVQKTIEAQKTVSKDFLWGDAHIISFICLLIGGILIGGWVTRKLSIPHPDDDQAEGSKNKVEPRANKDNDVVLVTMRKAQLQQLKKIQTYAENYRFYPLTEALLVGSVTFIAIFLTSYFIFYHALEAQKDEIREGLVRTAQAMTTTIDTSLHQTFTHKEQEETEAYQKAIKPFSQILALNKQIKFIYTIILKDDKIYFILDPTPKGDADGDGVEDSVDIMQEYDDPSGLLGQALRTQRMVVTQEPYTDQWGSLFGAYVPFYDHHGKFIGVLGMDITADKYFKRLMPIKRATIRAIVAGFFIAFLVGSLVWFTRNFSRVVNRNRLLLIEELKEQNEKLF